MNLVMNRTLRYALVVSGLMSAACAFALQDFNRNKVLEGSFSSLRACSQGGSPHHDLGSDLGQTPALDPDLGRKSCVCSQGEARMFTRNLPDSP